MDLARKQIYLTPAQDRAVKRLAKQQETTEANILRKALDQFLAIELTWRVILDTLARWTPADWEQTYEGEDGEPASFTRQWVIWHLIEHDLHHGGELSLTLGVHGLTAPDL